MRSVLSFAAVVVLLTATLLPFEITRADDGDLTFELRSGSDYFAADEPPAGGFSEAEYDFPLPPIRPAAASAMDPNVYGIQVEYTCAACSSFQACLSCVDVLCLREYGHAVMMPPGISESGFSEADYFDPPRYVRQYPNLELCRAIAFQACVYLP